MSNLPGKIPPLNRLLRLLMRFQQKNRYIGSAWGKLRIIEQQLLTELDSPAPVRPSELAWRLCLPKSNISHLIRGMKRKGLVVDFPFALDKREGRLSLTKKGIGKVREADEISNCLMHDFVRPLTFSAQRGLHEVFASLADGLGCPPSICRPGEHPLRVETRRITRVLGIITRNFASTGLSNVEVQALYLLDESKGLSREHLQAKLGLSGSAGARMLSELKKRALINAHRTASKSPAHFITLSTQGEEALRRLDATLGQFFLDKCGKGLERHFGKHLHIFEDAISSWDTDLVNLPKGPRVAASANYFEELIARALIQHTLADEGVTLRPEALKAPSDLILGYEGSTVVLSIGILGNELVGFGYNSMREMSGRVVHLVKDCLRETLEQKHYAALRARSQGAAFCHHLGIKDVRLSRDESGIEVPREAIH